MKIMDFLSTCTSQFYIALKIKLSKKVPKYVYLLILQLEQACYFPMLSPFGKIHYENIFNSLLVTIGGSNDIYICLNGRLSLETESTLA